MLYQKGLKNQENAAALQDAIQEGDCDEIAALVNGIGAERLPVDTFVMGVPRVMRAPRQVMRLPITQNPLFGDDDFIKEVHQLKDLAEMRDYKMTELPLSLPKGLRQVSMYLADEMVPDYEAGKNYGTDKRSWSKIQAGDMFAKPDGKMVSIKTPRHCAAYVHDDSPIMPWFKFLKSLIDNDMPRKMPAAMETRFKGQSNFVLMGMPFYMGLLGEALKMAGYVSFTTKWTLFTPRPEEAAPALDLGYLSQTYPEGSPTHPSRFAMHSFAALVLMYVLLMMFEGDAMLPHGETVEDEAMLLADNIGYWRLWAGVHYRSDHEACHERAKATAEYLCNQYFR